MNACLKKSFRRSCPVRINVTTRAFSNAIRRTAQQRFRAKRRRFVTFAVFKTNFEFPGFWYIHILFLTSSATTRDHRIQYRPFVFVFFFSSFFENVIHRNENTSRIKNYKRRKAIIGTLQYFLVRLSEHYCQRTDTIYHVRSSNKNTAQTYLSFEINSLKTQRVSHLIFKLVRYRYTTNWYLG